ITDPVLILGILEIVVGLLILLMGHLIGGFPHLFTLMIEKGGRFPWSFRSIISFIPLLSVALSSILLGVCFPLVCRISAKGVETIGTTAGVVFSIMALGALFGMAGGMGILFFGIGIIKGTQCAAWTFLLIGALILVLGTPLSVVRKTSLILLVIGIAAASLYYAPHQEMPLFRENTGRVSPISGRDFNSTGEDRAPRILALKNGIFSTLHIEKGHGDISLLINGTTVCSLPRDLSSRIFTGHIPLLFHENPREVLLLGLECGITLHALEQHPVRGLDCVEINPQICEASDLFHQFHQGVLEDPRIKMIHDDARHYLAFTRRNYDVIICQPCASPGAIPDLFTEEFFQQCRTRLSPGGIAALRIPAQGMKEESFRSILSAWHRVFPFAILWETSLGREYLITGSDRQMRWNDVLIDDRIQRPGIAPDCTAIHVVDPLVDIVSLFIMSGRDLPSYCRQAEPLSDDHALREAVMFQHVEDHPAEGLLEELQPYRGRGIDDVVPCIQDPAHSPLRERLQRAMEARHCLARAYGALVRGEPRNTVMPIIVEAMEKGPGNREVVQFYADTLIVTAKEHFERRHYDMALWTLKEIMHAMPDHMKATYLLGRTYYTMGLIEQARGEYEKVVACWPDDEEVRCRLGMAYLNSGWIDLAIDQFNRAIRFDPLYAESHLYLGAAYFKKDLIDKAIEEYGNALAIRPDYADAHYNLGIACLKSGLIDEAISAWKEVIRIRPDDVKARYNLAMAYYNHGALDESMAQLQEILRIRPDFVQARSLLNLINQAQGR
ncbi:MAG: tetratricopeptide repeat protein, partial [bacterium]